MVGWSFLFDTLLLQLGANSDIAQQEQVTTTTIYGIVVVAWLLLAIFSTHGSARVDECSLDGIVCGDHLCREGIGQGWSLDRKDHGYRFHNLWDTIIDRHRNFTIWLYE